MRHSLGVAARPAPLSRWGWWRALSPARHTASAPLTLRGCTRLPAAGGEPQGQHSETWARGSAGHAGLPRARSRLPRAQGEVLNCLRGAGRKPQGWESCCSSAHLPTQERHFLTPCHATSWCPWCLQAVQVFTGLSHRRIFLNSKESTIRNQHQLENPDRSSTMLVTYSWLIQPSLICLTYRICVYSEFAILASVQHDIGSLQNPFLISL